MSAPNAFRKNLAVVIGVDAYTEGIPVLRSAVNDARRLGEVLASDHGFTVLPLFDADASRAALDHLLTTRLPAEVGADDRVVFYFAGHGIAIDGDDGPAGFILPHDARRGEPDTYLEMTRLHDSLEALPCRHMLVVLDSCFSGAFRWSTLRDVMTVPGVVHQERYDRFVHDPAWQVLTSAASDQQAADLLLTGSLGSRGNAMHSPFALALFEGLAGAADLAPAGGDGIITATELYLYLEERLQVETLAQKRRQTPGLWPLRKQDKGEFVFLVPGRDLDLPPAPPLTPENNPYRGLASYNQEDAAVFFGRGSVVDDLSARVVARPVTVVLGASGTGKSSVVKAGVVPRLERDGGWTALPVVRPGAMPFQALALALSSGGADVAATTDGIRAAFAALATAGKNHLLVVDQFEELITLTRSPEVRAAFLDLLADLARDPCLRIIVTLRTDFEAQFDRSRLRDMWHAGRFVVPPLSRQDFRAVIEGPAAQRVIYFEPSSLVETLLDDVAAMPGGLPLLSFTLSEMYRRYVERDTGDRALSQQDYDDLGGVAGALRSRADAELAALDPAHQATLRRLMLRMLVVERGTLARQRVTRTHLQHWDPAESERIATVLKRLSDARLVVEGVATDGAAYVEPAHDALVTSWSRLLEWTHEAEEREPDLNFLHALARTAHEWNTAGAGDRGGLLWRDKVRSGRLWALRKSDRVQYNLVEDRFCRASVAQRRFVRNGLAALVATIVVAGILATGLGIVAQEQRAEAVAQRDEALRQTRAAWASTLTTKAAAALDGQGDSTMAVKLAKTALDAEPSHVAAAMLLRRAMYGPAVFDYRGHRYLAPPYTTLPATAVQWVAWSPDSTHLALGASVEEGGEMLVRAMILTADGKLRSTGPPEGMGWGDGVSFSRDGRFLVFAADPPMARDLDGELVSPTFAATLQPGAAPASEVVWEATMARGYDYATAVTPDGEVRAGQGIEQRFADENNWEFSPDRQFVARDLSELTEDEQDTFARFTVMRRGRVVSVVPGTEWVRTALTWDGQYVATGGLAGPVVLWRVNEDGEAVRLATLWSGSGQIYDLAFSPDGSRLMACGNGCRLWNLTAFPLAMVQDAPIGTALRSSRKPVPTAGPDGLSASLTSGGDYEAILAVEDAQTGAKWTRSFGTMDTQVLMLAGGLVAASDRRSLWLIDRLGVEESLVSVASSSIGTTADRKNVLLFDPEGGEAAVVLPTATADLIALATSAGLSTMTAAEIQRWDVGPILSGIRAMAERQAGDDTTASLLANSLRGLLGFGATPAGGASTTPEAAPDVAPAVAPVPEAWRALAPKEGAESEPAGPFYPLDVRHFLQELRDAGAIRAVLGMGGPVPFLSGPHRGNEWNLRSETFGQYNPAFVQWLAATLVPETRDAPLRSATQAFYDRSIRRMARIHAVALAALDRDPDLRATVATSYAKRTEDRGTYLFEALAPLVEALGPRQEGEPKDLVEAAGFWVRRELDGTAPDFRRGLLRLLAAYDPGFSAGSPASPPR